MRDTSYVIHTVVATKVVLAPSGILNVQLLNLELVRFCFQPFAHLGANIASGTRYQYTLHAFPPSGSGTSDSTTPS